MAYLAVVTVTPIKHLGSDPAAPPEAYLVRVIETGVDTNKDSCSIAGIPRAGRVVQVHSELAAGTGTTIRPALHALRPDGLTLAPIWTSLAAGDPIDDTMSSRYLAWDGLLKHYANVDAAADNTVETDYYILRDWE